MQCEVWSVKEAVGSEKCEVWSVKCEVWSVKFKFGVRRAQCEVWSVKCEVWSVKEAVRSEKCEVWSVECEVWSLECEECSVQCEVWSVEGRTRSGQVVFELQVIYVWETSAAGLPGSMLFFPCILGKVQGFSNLQAATYTFKTEPNLYRWPEDTDAEKKHLEAKVKVVSLHVGLQKLGSELRSVEVVFFRLLQSWMQYFICISKMAGLFTYHLVNLGVHVVFLQSVWCKEHLQ